MKSKTLYDLLPRIYRKEDIEKGYPLYAFMAVLESVYRAIEQDIDALYDNGFIETCDEWCIPYIADLLGIPGLTKEKQYPGAWRALVANTIGYRRRKGTGAALANAVRDATGWKTTAVEYFELLAASQTVKHPRPGRGAFVNLHRKNALAVLGTPFETTAHTPGFHGFHAGYQAITRPQEKVPGKYNIPNIGIFLYRLQSYPVIGGAAREIKEKCYTFHPFGLDIPLFNRPQPREDNNTVPGQQNLPVPLTRQLLQTQLDYPRLLIPAIRVFVRPSGSDIHREIKPPHIRVCNLEDWEPPPDILSDPGAQAAVDPETGRLVILRGKKPMEVNVDYSYGFSADTGGGPYSRRETMINQPTVPWLAYVSRAFARQEELPQDGANRFDTLSAALVAWAENGKKGIIRIMDSNTYDLTSLDFFIETSTNDWLAIEAAEGMCPCIIGNLCVNGASPGGRVGLNGLWVDGSIVLDGELHLTVTHCTVKPRKDTAITHTPTDIERKVWDLQVNITQSITGPIRLPEKMRLLQVGDSIIDGLNSNAIAAPGDESSKPAPRTLIERSTVLGSVNVKQLSAAADTIFTGPVTVKDTNEGYVRFSCLPKGSRVPMQYQCIDGGSDIRDLFTSVVYGQPGYVQLGPRCLKEIKTGAENGSEMGVFNHLYQPRREVCLKDALNQYFPYGLKPGVFYVT